MEVLPESYWQRCYVHFLRNARDYLPRKVADDCLVELRWLYDRRNAEEARQWNPAGCELAGPGSASGESVAGAATGQGVTRFSECFHGIRNHNREAINRMLALEATQLAQQWPRDDLPNPFDRASVDPDLPPESVSPVDQGSFSRRSATILGPRML
jgi:hypothetical protein